MKKTALNRRDFNRLSAVAFGGVMAGSLVGCGGGAGEGAGGGGGTGTDAELDRIAGKFEEGQFQVVARELRSFVDRHPDNKLAWTILGNTYSELERNDESEAAYHRALQIDPNMVEAITGLGVLLRKQGLQEQALEQYERAVAIDPDYAQAYSSMVVIHLQLSQYDRAVECGEQAVRLDPGDPVLFANLAVAYHYTGQFDRRDETAAEAERLGYRNMDVLRQIFSGELSI